jgi:hypothetical protein
LFLTPATDIGLVLLLAVLVYVSDEHPAFETRAGTLEASVVGLYGVVMIFIRWVR